MKIIKILILLASMLLMACTPTSAPVVDKSSSLGSNPTVHIARDNENLFLVAMKYNLDYQKLGRLNGISYPYKLQKGQRVRLSGGSYVVNKPIKIKVEEKKPVVKPSIKKPVKPPKSDNKPVIVNKPIKVRKQKTVAGIKWQWPLKGTLVKTYAASAENYKGIDIKARKGSNVRAVADGIVVYVGDGLAKYGNLIIISHKDIYLSAYAQLGKVLTDEGGKVKAGEKIATLGSKNLHFEIRKDADTVNPQELLP